jgi:hypothetical protein
VMTTDRDIWRAQLADMPWDAIEAWLMEQGYVIVGRDWHRAVMRDRLPPGYPPPTDDDLPFDGEDRRT